MLETTEKQVLEMLAKYAEIVNAQFESLNQRILVLEATLESDPQRPLVNKELLQSKQKKSISGLPRQLQAVQEAILKLRD